ncbi:hypothetical protein R5R35_001611 [Gryllus longicercus]|uniref:G-protein coupled receptors family 1 profile domain-containing protein n=1 Tax=Gryllus longicercus TaxID=2509291 RepID=A0AAN9Z2W3_9ORTH
MYNILLDMLLLVLPLVALAATYSLITRTLRQGMELEHALRSDGTPGPCDNGQVEMYVTANGSRQAAADGCRACAATGAAAVAAAAAEGGAEVAHLHHTCSLPSAKPSFRAHHLPTGLRRSNAEKSLLKKRRVIKMLCAVVLEFFVCWTPLYVINTIALFTPGMVYNGLGYTAISFFHLLAYSSSCCNPITYCFMNSSFRKSFLTLFRCRRRFTSKNLSDVSVSESTLVSRSQKWLQDTRIYEEHL